MFQIKVGQSTNAIHLFRPTDLILILQDHFDMVSDSLKQFKLILYRTKQETVNTMLTDQNLK